MQADIAPTTGEGSTIIANIFWRDPAAGDRAREEVLAQQPR
jgi:hypothetical protein